ncbi:hypothetical protein N8939_00490, partial [bacterium]|nr:hypothetical protein [bacterium]
MLYVTFAMQTLGYKFFKIQGSMLYLNLSKDTKMPLLILFIFGFFSLSFSQSNHSLVLGANQLNEYLPLVRNKRVAVVANQTSTVDQTH